MTTDKKRPLRMAETLRAEVSDIVAQELSDPRVVDVGVTRVEVTPDLRLATVFVRLLQHGEDEEVRARAMKGLTSASGFVRREVTARLQLRASPEIRFRYDTDQEKKVRVEALLREVAEDEKKRAGS